MTVLKDGHGYDVVRQEQLPGHIMALRCQFCPFSVNPRLLHKSGDKSGQGRYNRARGKMVAHIHAEHRPLPPGRNEG